MIEVTKFNILQEQERPPRPAAGNPYTPQHLHKYPHPTVPHVGVQVKV